MRPGGPKLVFAAVRRRSPALLLAPTLVVLSLVAASVARAGPRPLVTAVSDPQVLSGPESQLGLRRMRAAGAAVVRINVGWDSIAPVERPRDFVPADPSSPGYTWEALDLQVRLAFAAGLEPLLKVAGVPGWARVDPLEGARPNLVELNAFASAAATRYGGKSPGLPRVRYWQLWNEPNLNSFLTPQFDGSEPVSPGIYRAMVNEFARAVHAAHADNLVVAGGLSPFTVSTRFFRSVAPLDFMRRLLCMSNGPNPRAICKTAVHFDVWSHHPYTSGGPTHQAVQPDDVSLGDLPEMRELLDAAVRAGNIVASRPVRFWVTEFGWDTDPPDDHALPVRLQARWTSEALHRMWLVGISLVTWYLLRDDVAPPQGDFQTGLWYRGSGGLASDRPKATLTAFRYPFVAYARKGRIVCWGRTPWGRSARVLVELTTGQGWHRVARVQADRFGIFRTTVASTATKGYLRASSAAGTSLPFSLTEPPDRTVPPFGIP